MRGVVATAAALAFAAGLILDPAGVVRMALFCASGGFGMPGRAVMLGLGGAMAAIAVLAVLRRQRPARRVAVAVRGSRPHPVRPPKVRPLQAYPSSGKPVKAAAPRPARIAARPVRQVRRKG